MYLRNDIELLSMERTSAISTTNITEFRLIFKYPITEFEKTGLKDLVDSLKIGEFRVTKFEELGLYELLDEVIPVITLSGKGIELSVKRKSIELNMGSRTPSLLRSFRGVPTEIEPEKIFSKENLDSVQTDLNYVMGLVFGKLGLKPNEVEVECLLSIWKEGLLGRNFNYLLKDESFAYFGKCIDTNIEGLNIALREQLGDLNVESKYKIKQEYEKEQEKKFVSLTAELNFKPKGLINISSLLERLIERINTLVANVVGGIVV